MIALQSKIAAIIRGTGAAKKQPGLSTELKENTMASVLELNTPTKSKKQPDAGTVHWFDDCVARAKTSGPFAEITVVTPGLAEQVLERNPDNRNLKPTKLGHFATDMLAGEWTFNGEPIIISRDGELNDGQHRLRAVAEAGTPQPFLVVFGLSRESRTTVDQGSARTAADYLTMDGVPNAAQAAGIARLVMAYEASGGKTLSRAGDFTNAQILGRVETDAEIADAARFASATARYMKGLAIPSVVGACLYVLAGEHAGDARAYMEQIAYGESIKRGDPAFAARTALANLDRPDKAARMEIIFRGWNAYRQNRPLSLAKSLGTLPALV